MTENDVKRFQSLLEKETGEKVSLEEAGGYAESLIEMIRLVYKPITKKAYVRCTKNPDAI